MSSWSAGRWVRMGVLAVVLVFFLAIGHVAGVFIDFAILCVYGGVRLGLKIFKGTHGWIARNQAEAIVNAQEARAAQQQPPPPPAWPAGDPHP